MTKVLNRGLKAYGEVRAQNLGFIAGERVGGTVTQATNKSTAVTLNRVCGTITMNGAALNAGVEVSHTVNNNTVNAGDVVVVSIRSGATAGAYAVTVDAVANGSFRVSLSNQSAGNLSEAIVYNFAVIKAVSN
jgi:hypothetical protein